MTATPNEIKRAIWTELSRLVAGYVVTDATPTEMEVFSPPQQDTSTAQPFRSLHHFAGEVSRALSDSREHGAAITALKKVPAMLLAWEGTRPQGASGAHTADGPQLVQVVSRAHWRVFVVVADRRGDAWAMDATLEAQHAVETALSEFTIPGLFDGGAVRWVETVPWVTARRDSYITVARFFADTDLPAHADPTPGVPFTLQGQVREATPDTDAAVVTVSPFSLD